MNSENAEEAVRPEDTSDTGGDARSGPPDGSPDGSRRDSESELHGPWRWVGVPLEVLVRVYQLVISPLLPPSCRFYPSCSAYSLTALRRFGPVWGTWLTIARLARCHPWNPGGVDHVPRRGPDGRPVRDDGSGSTRHGRADEAADH